MVSRETEPGPIGGRDLSDDDASASDRTSAAARKAASRTAIAASSSIRTSSPTSSTPWWPVMVSRETSSADAHWSRAASSSRGSGSLATGAMLTLGTSSALGRNADSELIRAISSESPRGCTRRVDLSAGSPWPRSAGRCGCVDAGSGVEAGSGGGGQSGAGFPAPGFAAAGWSLTLDCCLRLIPASSRHVSSVPAGFRDASPVPCMAHDAPASRITSSNGTVLLGGPPGCPCREERCASCRGAGDAPPGEAGGSEVPSAVG